MEYSNFRRPPVSNKKLSEFQGYNTVQYSTAIYPRSMQQNAPFCGRIFKTAIISKSSVSVDKMASEPIRLQPYDVNRK